GDEALGMYSCCPYTLDLNTDTNKRFVAAMNKDYGVDPGFYCAGLYVNGMVVEAGLQKTGGKSDDKTEFMKAMKSVSLTHTPGGPVKSDNSGKVIGDFSVRHLKKANDKFKKKTVKFSHNVTHFWPSDEKKFLEPPVFSRNYPPLKS